MAVKSSPSMMCRYTGKDGRQRLIDSLCIQQTVASDRKIAQKLATAGELIDVKKDEIIIQQGNSDNDIYFIICGMVTVSINGREISERKAGSHVGEMALLDPTARRSATVAASERSVILQVKETKITTIASQHPEFWRRIASEMASRLRERSKFISEPHAEPVVFIGSSSEALNEAEWVCKSLNRRPAVCRLWTQGVFQLSKTTIEDLMSMAIGSDFAVLILTPDDMTGSRGKRNSSPRDNMVFELGLFMGALSRERTFIVTGRGVDLKLPTDLLGITHVQFSKGSKKTLGSRFQPVTRAIWKRIQELGPK